MERLSVVVTARNCAGLVLATLQSVAAALAYFRTDDRAPHGVEAEVVVVEDGSVDGTAAVVQNFLENRAGWRLVRRSSSSSPSYARNTGAHNAHGSLLFFLDGGDLFLPNHLAECWAALRDPAVDYVKTGVRFAHPVHADWRPRIEFNLPINLCVRRHCHDFIGGFPDYLLCRRTEDGLRPETDVFFKIEDMFYNKALQTLFRGRTLTVPTVEYCRHPGNDYDRQYEQYRRSVGSYPEVRTDEENHRLQLAEVVFRHRLQELRRAGERREARPPGTGEHRGADGGALAQARKYHQAGDLVRAEQFYREALRSDSTNAQAWYLLGVVRQAAGRPADSAEALRTALVHDPRHASAHNHLGFALAAQRLYDEAAECFRQSLVLQPDSAEARHNLGLVLREQGRLDDAEAEIAEALRMRPDFAEAHYSRGTVLAARDRRDEAAASWREALRLKPDLTKARQALYQALLEQGRSGEVTELWREAVRALPSSHEAHANLGRALQSQGHKEEAVVSFREALRLRPDCAEVHHELSQVLADLDRPDEAATHLRHAIRLQPDLAAAHNNLGALLRRQGRSDEALASCREAVRLAPAMAEAHNNLGLVLLDCDKLDEGTAALQEALRLNPTFAAAHNNLGIAHWRAGRLDEARACYGEALRRQPDFAEAASNLGNILHDLGQFDEAEVLFDRAIALEPDCADAHWNRALSWLLRGDFTRGWPEYEWRWRLRTFPRRTFSQPRWDGGPLHGKTILLHAEQGLGDTLQFVRYAPLVKQRGATVVLQVQPPLVRLLTGMPGVDVLLPEKAPLPPFDVHAPLLSLPLLFGTDLGSIPAEGPYLHPDPALVERWRTQLAALPGFTVGIAWMGSGNYRTNHRRSIPLEAFEPLARVEGVQLISLQKGSGSEQVRAIASHFPVVELPGLDETAGPFMDTAAVLRSLDLVVCCDTALGHLAGALGVPCGLALMAVPDSRWLLDRDDSPWYPRHRLFRQHKRGDWDGVFQRIADALRLVCSV
jgi:tetratricopeptide (TPR) repeat protein